MRLPFCSWYRAVWLMRTNVSEIHNLLSWNSKAQEVSWESRCFCRRSSLQIGLFVVGNWRQVQYRYPPTEQQGDNSIISLLFCDKWIIKISVLQEKQEDSSVWHITNGRKGRISPTSTGYSWRWRGHIFRRVRKIAKSYCLFRRVCPSVHMEQLGPI